MISSVFRSGVYFFIIYGVGVGVEFQVMDQVIIICLHTSLHVAFIHLAEVASKFNLKPTMYV